MGKLVPGTLIRSINGVDLIGKTVAEASRAIKLADAVVFVIGGFKRLEVSGYKVSSNP
jgi:hypothetical protein